MPETEAIDRLYLELSQFTKAKTARETELEMQIARCLGCFKRLEQDDLLDRTLADDVSRLKAECVAILKD